MMGFGDERSQHLRQLQSAATEISNRAFPDLNVVPGGDYTEWRQKRESAAQVGPAILEQLARDGLIDRDAVKRKYEGEQ